MIKNIYYRALISARTSGGITNKFLITIGLHQGSTLSPYLFVLVIDELTKLILRGSLLVYAFVDNIVLVNETSSGVNLKLKIWRDALESKSFRWSRTKMKYMKCKFDKSINRDEWVIRLDGQEILKSESFWYIGSIIHKNWKIKEDVNYKKRVWWMRWRSTLGVLCDHRIPKL